MTNYSIFNRITDQHFNTILFIFSQIQQLICFFFLDFVSCCNFTVIPKGKGNNKANTDVIRPNNLFFFLTSAKILVPENTVKNRVKILLEISRIVKYLLSLLVKDC